MPSQVNFAGAFRVTAGELELSVDLAPGEGDTSNVEQDLPHLLVAMAEAAADRHTAVGLFIDEVRYLFFSELAAVIGACHEIAQRNLPFPFNGVWSSRGEIRSLPVGAANPVHRSSPAASSSLDHRSGRSAQR